jgi:hypothetical protein
MKGESMDEHEKRIDLNSELGMTRRDLIRRGAIVGGTLLWVAPAIQSLAPKAFAQEAGPGSERCAVCYCWTGPDEQHATRDKGFDGLLGDAGLSSASDCHDFCFHQGAYSVSGGAPGAAYTGGSEFCSAVTAGGSCDSNTHIEDGPNGVTCN